MTEPLCINLYFINKGGQKQETSFQNRIYDTSYICPAITTCFQPWYLIMNEEVKCDVIGKLEKYSAMDLGNRVYSVEGVAPTCTAHASDTLGKILVKQATKEGFIEMQNGGVCDLSFPESETRRGRVQEGGDVCPTLTAQNNGICRIESKIMVENIEQMVRVRKYKVDVCGLQKLLKEHKTKSISQIAEALKVPKTKVEHWFRTDSSFSIPDENVWFDLKKLLKIQTNEYDKQIMEFEIKNNVYEKSNRCYSSEGISPTLTAVDNNIKTKIGYRIRKLTPLECFRLMGVTDEDAKKMLEVNSNSQCYKQAGNSIVVDVMAAMFSKLF